MKDEFVMVRRAQLARLQENMDPHRGAVAWGVVCGLLEKDCHGEPVALPARKAITAQGLTALDSEAEGWNACLDEIAKLGPLYTHADSGEVERLHSKIETMRRKNNEYCEEVMTLRKENARLRLNISERNDEASIRDDQLAERDALLRDIDAFMDPEPGIPSLGLELEKRLTSALSASADPSAPEVTLASYAEDMSTCTLTKGDGFGYFYDRVDANGPSAPVERDERAEFVVPEGYALVPKSMLLDKDVIGAINFHCGDTTEEEGGQFGQYADGRLWVGFVLDDEGTQVHGLHVATDEYPEEGSTTLVEFPEARAALERKP